MNRRQKDETPGIWAFMAAGVVGGCITVVSDGFWSWVAAVAGGLVTYMLVWLRLAARSDRLRQQEEERADRERGQELAEELARLEVERKREEERRHAQEQLAYRPYREAIPRSVKMYVWQRDGGRCVQCGSNERLEYDHIIPLSKGGSNTERNIQLLCERCNREKGASI